MHVLGSAHLLACRCSYNDWRTADSFSTKVDLLIFYYLLSTQTISVRIGRKIMEVLREDAQVSCVHFEHNSIKICLCLRRREVERNARLIGVFSTRFL